MKRHIKIVFYALFFLFLFSDQIFAMVVDFHGRIQSTYVVRDTDGFQHGVLDETNGAQWRNELKFDLAIRPEYEGRPLVKIDKFFINYRGAYDAIFDITDKYDDVRDKSPDDYELGKDDLKYENDLREAFIDILAETSTQTTMLRIGRQIVQWGEADGFNVMNVINPQDNSVLMFFETPDDLATPIWMGRLDYSRRNLGFLENFNAQLVATPDIRPHLFSVMDDNMDAPYAFGFKQLKDKSLEFIKLRADQFASFGPPFDVIGGSASINDLEKTAYPVLDQTIAPGINQIVQWHDNSASRGIDHLEYGGRLTSSFGDVNASLYYFRGYQDDGVMNFSEFFTKGNFTFDHPKQNYIGASFNMYIAPLNAVIRGEGNLVDEVAILDLEDCWGGQGALVQGLYLDGPENARGYSMHKVYQGLLGFDKDLWIRKINSTSMIKTSWQFYWKHIDDWDYDKTWRPFDEEDNYRLTCFIWSDFWYGRIHPEIFCMYDFEHVLMTMASVKYTYDGKWFYKLTQMSFWGDSDAISPFTQPVNLINTSELSFRVGYEW